MLRYIFAACHFHCVILDEIGGLELYIGCLLLGLARNMAVILGDPLQGSLPCTSLADKHVNGMVTFHSHSYRYPQEVMDIVEPAYQARFKDPALSLTGVRGRSHWCVHTLFDSTCIGRLRLAYGDDLLVLAFTNDVVASIPHAFTVDAAIGLQGVVVVIFEKNMIIGPTNMM